MVDKTTGQAMDDLCPIRSDRRQVIQVWLIERDYASMRISFVSFPFIATGGQMFTKRTVVVGAELL